MVGNKLHVSKYIPNLSKRYLEFYARLYMYSKNVHHSINWDVTTSLSNNTDRTNVKITLIP